MTVTGVLHQTTNSEVANAFFHTVAGWCMPVMAFGMLWVELKVLSHLFIDRPAPPPVRVAREPIARRTPAGPRTPWKRATPAITERAADRRESRTRDRGQAGVRELNQRVFGCVRESMSLADGALLAPILHTCEEGDFTVMPQEAAFPEPGHRSPGDRSEPNAVAGRIEAALRDSSPPAPALSSAPTAGDLLRALRRRWMLALALGGTLAGIAAVAVWYLMTPEYTAYAQIRVLSTQPTVNFSTADRAANQTPFTTYLRTQATQFKDHKVIEAALKRDEVKH